MALAVKGAGSGGHAASLAKAIPCPRSMGHQAVHPHLHHQCSHRDEEQRQSTSPLPFPRALLTLCSGRASGRVCEPRRIRGPQGHGTFALLFSPGERLVWEHLGVLEKQVHAVRQTCENSTALGQSRGASWEPHDAACLFPQGPGFLTAFLKLLSCPGQVGELAAVSTAKITLWYFRSGGFIF